MLLVVNYIYESLFFLYTFCIYSKCFVYLWSCKDSNNNLNEK